MIFCCLCHSHSCLKQCVNFTCQLVTRVCAETNTPRRHEAAAERIDEDSDFRAAVNARASLRIEARMFSCVMSRVSIALMRIRCLDELRISMASRFTMCALEFVTRSSFFFARDEPSLLSLAHRSRDEATPYDLLAMSTLTQLLKAAQLGRPSAIDRAQRSTSRDRLAIALQPRACLRALARHHFWRQRVQRRAPLRRKLRRGAAPNSPRFRSTLTS